MKAITCSQCGALITKISMKIDFASCDYCHAKIPIKRARVLEIPSSPKAKERKKNTWKLTEKEKRTVFSSIVKEDEPVYNFSPEQKQGILIVLGIILVVGLPILLYNLLSDPEKHYLDFKMNSTITYDIVEEPWFEKVSYTKLKRKDLTASTIAGLKDIPFNKRKVTVEVFIDDDGKVKSAEIISGNKLLNKFALDAAYKTTFQPQTLRKTKSKTYTYHFSYR